LPVRCLRNVKTLYSPQAFPFTPEDVCIQKTAYGFVDHVFETFGPLGQGVPLVVCPKAARAGVPLAPALHYTHCRHAHMGIREEEILVEILACNQ